MPAWLTTANDALSAWPWFLIRGSHLAGAVVCVVVFVGLAGRAVADRTIPARLLRIAAGSAAVLVLGANTLLVLTYPVTQAYEDHGEPNVVMLAVWRNAGHLLYPSWNNGEGFYGLIYGPLMFQLEGAVLALSPTVLGSKLPGVMACICFYLVLWRLLAGSAGPRDRWSVLLLLGMTSLVTLAFANATFWIRPEPFLMLFVALGLLSAVRLRAAAGAVCLGLACGAATGFKLSAPVYFAGAAFCLLAAQPGWRGRFVIVLAGGLAWAAITAAPFIDPAVTVSGYARYFAMASDQGLKGERLFHAAMFAALLGVPAIAILFRREGHLPEVRWMAGGHLLGLATGAVIAGKPGGGPHHLLPFIPVMTYLGLQLVNARRVRGMSGGSTIAAGVMLCLLLTHGPLALVQIRNLGGTLFRLEPLERKKAAEVAAMYSEHPDAVMGLGGTASYRDTYHRVQGVLSGRPAALLEVPAWMEMEKAGASPTILDSAVKDCSTPWWIIPNEGAPFSFSTEYVHERELPLFSDRFRTLFFSNFEPGERREFYSFWRCKRG